MVIDSKHYLGCCNPPTCTQINELVLLAVGAGWYMILDNHVRYERSNTFHVKGSNTQLCLFQSAMTTYFRGEESPVISIKKGGIRINFVTCYLDKGFLVASVWLSHLHLYRQRNSCYSSDNDGCCHHCLRLPRCAALICELHHKPPGSLQLPVKLATLRVPVVNLLKQRESIMKSREQENFIALFVSSLIFKYTRDFDCPAKDLCILLFDF